eukprot:gnl/MRDRNA2_/MRDRNA2_59347_c0_seq1.p1 gnl/MRDRNA2_/MRDRNA2_59347_c0~~gnl/MRDRNA2_/MRDRNA2_59347_c0_seq1.p1  ORF type:complete len:334 (-),score=46.30 gnl/MRDRNA2_/MRDRNA2_59347_c0_seq1:152-1114(-)
MLLLFLAFCAGPLGPVLAYREESSTSKKKQLTCGEESTKVHLHVDNFTMSIAAHGHNMLDHKSSASPRSQCPDYEIKAPDNLPGRQKLIVHRTEQRMVRQGYHNVETAKGRKNIYGVPHDEPDDRCAISSIDFGKKGAVLFSEKCWAALGQEYSVGTPDCGYKARAEYWVVNPNKDDRQQYLCDIYEFQGRRFLIPSGHHNPLPIEFLKEPETGSSYEGDKKVMVWQLWEIIGIDAEGSLQLVTRIGTECFAGLTMQKDDKRLDKGVHDCWCNANKLSKSNTAKCNSMMKEHEGFDFFGNWTAKKIQEGEVLFLHHTVSK